MNEDVARGVAWRDLCRLFSKFIRKKLGAAAGWESQRFVTLKNRAGDAAVGGHPVKRGGRCCSRGTCCVGGGRCGWEPPQVVTLKNRKMWGEDLRRRVGLPVRGDMRILM